MSWFFDSAHSLLWVVISCAVFYLFIIVTTRVVGLRSFTTFSSFDFLITLSMGALLASTVVSREIALLEGFMAICTLFLLQMGVSLTRARWNWVRKVIDNKPTLLMENGQVLHDNLRAVRITEDELRAKLRGNNVYNYAQVKAVVLESSGDVSILRQPNQELLPELTTLEGVIRRV